MLFNSGMDYPGKRCPLLHDKFLKQMLDGHLSRMLQLCFSYLSRQLKLDAPWGSLLLYCPLIHLVTGPAYSPESSVRLWATMRRVFLQLSRKTYVALHCFRNWLLVWGGGGNVTDETVVYPATGTWRINAQKKGVEDQPCWSAYLALLLAYIIFIVNSLIT